MEIPKLVAPEFFEFNLGFIINKPVLIVIFVIYVILYLSVSAVLFYHWASYGMKNKGILVARGLYTLVSIILLVMSGLSLYYF